MKLGRILVQFFVIVVLLVAADTIRASEEEKVPLVLKLPSSNCIPPDSLDKEAGEKPGILLIAKGATNVAFGMPVTTSGTLISGKLSQITDGTIDGFDSDTVEMKKGVQWVQVDLGKSYAIQAIAIWHNHIHITHDVVMQMSNDAEFKTGVTTLFNNDTNNSSGFGAGTDPEYFETKYGRAFDGRGIKARYVRGYTNGSSLGNLNCWQEIEVYAVPNK